MYLYINIYIYEYKNFANNMRNKMSASSQTVYKHRFKITY